MIFFGVDPGYGKKGGTGVAGMRWDDAQKRIAWMSATVLTAAFTGPKAFGAVARAVNKWINGVIDGSPDFGDVDFLIVEIPQIYERSKGDDNDLVGLSLIAGGVLALTQSQNPITYTPREWKKTTPKHIMTERIRKRVPDLDLSGVLVGLQHNALDAVGLCLYHAEQILRCQLDTW